MTSNARERTVERSAAWLRARARNTHRRALLFAVVAITSAGLGLLAMLTLPAVAASWARERPEPRVERDTIAVAFDLARAESQLSDAEGELTRARAEIARRERPPEPIDTVGPESRARRDSLRAVFNQLGQLIQRAEGSPIPPSYRALADAEGMRGAARVQALLDTLNQVEQTRNAFGAAGGVDPVFVALTTRANEIGREIRAVAQSRRQALSAELAQLAPITPPRPDFGPPVDTLPMVAARDTAAAAAGRLEEELDRSRAELADIAERRAEARTPAVVRASPLVLLLASGVIGLVLGFAATLMAEIRAPRVGDGREAAQLAAAPLLTSVRDSDLYPERLRREADRQIAPFVDQVSDTYRALYGHLADANFDLTPTVVVGDDADVTAVVAANLAAAAAFKERSALLVDIDLERSTLASVLRIRRSPGTVDVVSGSAEWSETITPTLVGRDRTVDVIPAGHPALATDFRAAARRAAESIPMLARRYDTVVVSSPSPGFRDVPPAARVLGSVVLCARSGRTPNDALRTIADLLRTEGVDVRGVVLWETDPPPVPELRDAPRRATSLRRRASDELPTGEPV